MKYEETHQEIDNQIQALDVFPKELVALGITYALKITTNHVGTAPHVFELNVRYVSTQDPAEETAQAVAENEALGLNTPTE